MNNRVLIGGLIGAVALFLLGFLIYGFMLSSMMTEYTMPGLAKEGPDFSIVVMFFANLAMGFLLAYILDKGNANTMTSGATMGGIVGLLFGLAVNLSLYASTNYWTSMTGVLVDTIVAALIFALVGAVIGWYYGRGRTVATPVVRV